jgi:hypothetical protein
MGQSLRIRSKLGINQTINVPLDQEYEFLEILSLKILQADIYTRSCAEYGVVVGRVTANNGFGVPNAKISVFIPIQDEDLNNPLITSVYPYTVPTDKNDDGYRYNLLPYEKSYSKHAATGTFPTRLDALTDATVIELVDKYYKFTVRTNDSGDYMIMGVPLGFQTLVMDVDLSDIGEFSLTPQDLIRMGLATESQVAGNQFRSSEDLESLPQIINVTKTVEISPLWGEPEICQIAINRVDFDLRDDANVDIQPTAVFMGSIFSTTDNLRLRGEQYFAGIRVSSGCKPRENMGNLCNLVAGPGQILAIRQTINQDENGNPILEQYELEQSGNVIDDDGTWLVEVPMNLEYIVTNEFGDRVISLDSSIGIPTKGNYRFKIKWQQPKDLTQQTRRAYFLVPNVREFGWTSNSDPNYLTTTSVQGRQLASSYYFGLDWTGYTDGITTIADRNTKIDEIVNCEDTFYSFGFNRVYTVSGLIDQYKNGANRGRFIGIKEIDDDDCSSTVNKFPVNDGVRNFDFLFFVVSFFLQIIQLIGIPIIIVLHFIAFIWNFVLVPLRFLFTAFFAFQATWYLVKAIKGFISYGTKQASTAACFALSPFSFGLLVPVCAFMQIDSAATLVQANKDLVSSGKWFLTLIGFKLLFRLVKERPFPPIKLTSLTYPQCQTCDCRASDSQSGIAGFTDSFLTLFADYSQYATNVVEKTTISQITNPDEQQIVSSAFITVLTTNLEVENNLTIYKTMKSETLIYLDESEEFFYFSKDLPFPERINIFNLRKSFFNGINKISVSFNSPYNSTKHFDNTLTLMSQTPIEAGTLLTFIDPALSSDVNFKYSGDGTTNSTITGISGTPLNPLVSTYNVEYATSQTTNGQVSYNLNVGSTVNNYKFPSDIEYYQVITAITVSEAAKIWQTTNSSSLPGILNSSVVVTSHRDNKIQITPSIRITNWEFEKDFPAYKYRDLFSDFDNQYILILQRGVDPYSPKYTNKYGLGILFGYDNEDAVVVTGQTRLNIPIQKLNNNSASVQLFNNQSNIFYPSHFFRGGDGFSSFTTSTVGYYSALDASTPTPSGYPTIWNKPVTNSVREVVSNTANRVYDIAANPARYGLAEDLSGGAYYYMTIDGERPNQTKISYFTSSLLPSLTANPMSISSKVTNVMRTDRLPSSDYLDGSDWSYNPSLLQQNIGFAIYEINTDDDNFTTTSFKPGGDMVGPDIGGLPGAENVFKTFECKDMVSLSCYTGNSTTFGVSSKCATKDSVENGCYVIMKKPLTDLFNGKDLQTWAEWGYRFRFFYGLCRGVLSQSFVNNWVNGALFAYPIQVDTFFDKQNKPSTPSFCKETVYFDSKTNNFYYRSSPYNNTSNLFVGKSVLGLIEPINQRLLQYPTTVMNLGWKDSFYSEVSFEPSTRGYVMNELNPTSYSDTSDLINLFVVSRITDETFVERLTSGLNPDNNLDQLFSRPEKRIDGDLAQLMSINSEEGVIKFSPEYYSLTGSQDDPVIVSNPISSNPTIGVFFSSTTENLQLKDFLSPGRIDFRETPTSNFTPYTYGIKSQEVPYYKWLLEPSPTIFGTEKNNWATRQDQIGQSRYQSLDRTTATYYQGQGVVNDQNKRGYIFKVKNDSTLVAGTTYDYVRADENSEFLVGAPFHFYFGLIQGATALDKFKTKYALDE